MSQPNPFHPAFGVDLNAGHGLVKVAFPYLREYLREHAASIVWDES